MATKRAGRVGKAGPSQGAQRQVGYAVVGLGHIAQEAVLPAFAHAKKNSRLVALVSSDPTKQKKLGQKYGARGYSYEEFEECLNSPDVDAVYIALPNTQHAEYAIRAARAGAHVLCEKPMAMNERECRQMISACDDSGVELMIAYRLHFDEANLKAVEAIQKGKLGDPRLFTSSFSFQMAKENIRTERDAGGGVLWDIGIYCINAARALFRAEPTDVFAFEARGKDKRFAEVEEGVGVVMKFPEERLATFNVSSGGEATAVYEVVGSKGKLKLENGYEYAAGMTLTVTQKGKSKVRSFKKRDQFAPELLYFSDCVMAGRSPEPNGYEGLADIRIITALYESIRTGSSVSLPPFEKKGSAQ